MIACFKLFAERGSEYARKEYKHIMTSYVGALEVGTSNSRLAGFHLGLVNGCMWKACNQTVRICFLVTDEFLFAAKEAVC